jgi:hypothetical protein
MLRRLSAQGYAGEQFATFGRCCALRGDADVANALKQDKLLVLEMVVVAMLSGSLRGWSGESEDLVEEIVAGARVSDHVVSEIVGEAASLTASSFSPRRRLCDGPASREIASCPRPTSHAFVGIVLPVIVGKSYSAASDPLAILMFRSIAQFGAALLSPVVFLHERTAPVGAGNVLAVLVNVVGDIVIVAPPGCT